jgi:trigger factor
MYESQADELLREFVYRLQTQGMDLEIYSRFTGMDAETIKKSFRTQAENQVKIRLALEKVAQLENIEVSEGEIDAEIERLSKLYNVGTDRVKAVIDENTLKKDIAVGKAAEIVKKNAETVPPAPAAAARQKKKTVKKPARTKSAKTEEKKEADGEKEKKTPEKPKAASRRKTKEE